MNSISSENITTAISARIHHDTMYKDSKKLRPVMFVGTGSDVGKSVITAGFCRIFKQDGYAPAPFRAQNMSLNSYVTADGLELGRAQAVQAEAAGVPCESDMEPGVAETDE